MNKPEIIEDAHMEYLKELRDDGSVNMMGAGPYLQREFGVTRREARDIVLYWMGGNR